MEDEVPVEEADEGEVDEEADELEGTRGGLDLADAEPLRHEVRGVAGILLAPTGSCSSRGFIPATRAAAMVADGWSDGRSSLIVFKASREYENGSLGRTLVTRWQRKADA